MKKYICENCRKEVNDSQSYCHECGSQFKKINDVLNNIGTEEVIQKIYNEAGSIDTYLDKDDLIKLGWDVDDIPDSAKDMLIRYDNGDIEGMVEVETDLGNYEPIMIADNLREFGDEDGLYELIDYLTKNNLIKEID